MPDSPSFLITTRPARIVSMEQEFTSGSRYVSDALGLGGIDGYHSGPREYSNHLRMERDSSCEAELIYGRWDLSQHSIAADFADTVRRVDDLRASGTCSYGYSAGLHVHCDATGESFATLRALYLVFNHLEDALYRLASAGYGRHRDEHTGNDYAGPTRKGIRSAVDLERWGRSARGGLNLSNYLGAVMNCSCGAVRLGAWEECTCRDRYTRTVEFRLWNATTRPRKVHTYVTLSHALMDWAARHHNVNPVRLPERPYLGHDRGRAGDSRKALRFILSQLNLSAEERRSILWTARRSSLRDLCGADAFAALESEFGGEVLPNLSGAEDDRQDLELVAAVHYAGHDDDDDDDDRDDYDNPFDNPF